MTTTAWLLIALPLFVIGSCNKKLSSYNENFLGIWHFEATPLVTPGDSVRNEIVFESDDAAYRYSCQDVCAPNLCNCQGQRTGKPVINSSRTMIRIGSSGAQPLSIEAEPYQDAQGKWVMEVGGLTYYRQ